MKIFAKQIIAGTVIRLPRGAREAVLDALCAQDGDYGVMMRLAQHNHVTGFVVDGQYGPMLGSSTDNAVLEYYATHGVGQNTPIVLHLMR